MKLSVAAIVEGHGEVSALPVLLRRLAAHMDPALSVRVPLPIRVKRDKAVGAGTDSAYLAKYLDLARGKAGQGGGVLVLLDAERGCAAHDGPALARLIEEACVGLPCAITLAVQEYETWLLGSAESLRGRCSLPHDLEPPPNPESVRDAKGWLTRHMPDGVRYKETQDQAALSSCLDIARAQERCPSLARFCREVERLFRDMGWQRPPSA